MALKGPLRLGTSALALILGVLAPLVRASAQTAGSVGAVNPAATGTPPGGGARSLVIGNTVVRNERLQTSATGTLHVTFSDRTTLNLGPNTSIVIDSYVYNPATGEGNLKVNLRSGLLRFVGGQTSHQGNASVETPVATIGIRGNMMIATYRPGQGLTVKSLASGALTVSNAVNAVVLNVPGFQVQVTSATTPIPPPTRASSAEIGADFAATTSGAGRTGGSPVSPPPGQALQYGVGTPALPSTSGSALGIVGTQNLQPGIGRNSAQGRQPTRAGPRRPVANPNPDANPYGDSR